jgi:thiamine-phosphate pyrophosphorylase
MCPLNSGIQKYLLREELDLIKEAPIGIAGLGGLGSNCAQALVRLGFKKLTLVDFDRIEASNLNRQFYFADQLDRYKTEALRENLLRISPDLELQLHGVRIDKENKRTLFSVCCLVVEALDQIPEKKMLIEGLNLQVTPIISASGLGNKGQTDGIVTRRINRAWTVIGDFKHCVTQGISPLAPGVQVAAAKQAGAVLDWVLARGEKPPFELPDLYGLTYSRCSRRRSNIEVVKEMIQAGIKLIQYREKDRSLEQKYRECREIRELTRQAGVTFIVNDHLDIAQLVGADGVHLGQDDLPVDQARSLLGSEKIIGKSTHSPEQARQAMAEGADYLGVGPIYATQTKTDVCDPVGYQYLEWAAENIDIPWVAIGGIKKHNLHEILNRGASCTALVSEITGHKDIPQVVKEIRTIIKEKNNEL